LGKAIKKAITMKLKTKKAAAKRFSFTATGKIKFKRTGKRHNMGNKSSARKLKLRSSGILSDGDMKHIEKCMPYGK
jgi:large subunit ribosomal protein L35